MEPITLTDLFNQNKEIMAMVDRNYVHKIEFLPVKLLVYGAVAIILSAVVGKGVGYLVNNSNVVTLVQAAR